MASSKNAKHYLLVAAIDFGTTYSSSAYQFKHNYDRDPSKVVSKVWPSTGNFSNKAPTTVLIHPDGKTLHSFGYEAEDKFAELATEDKHESWFYFRQFKMKLFHAEEIDMDMTLEAQNGQELSALLIFSLVIAHLKTDLMDGVNKQLAKGGITDRDVLWVLTVPAIWNDGAKHFMRQAAIKAGIDGENLLIALEPEAASVYCKQLALDPHSGVEGITIEMLSPGQKYILLDAGGGTIDINVHEVLENNDIREMHKPTGSSCGGTTVDKAFRKFLIELFGQSVIETLQNKYLDECLTLFRHFEIEKRAVSYKREKTSYLQLPFCLIELCKSETGRGVPELIAQSQFVEHLSLVRGNKLKMSASVMRQFYDESITNITSLLATILKDHRVKGCKTILMVGGYSECDLLQEEIKQKFPDMDVIIPSEASLAVLKGAVMYGRNPQVIASRVCKYTYGMRVSTRYNPAIHPASRTYVDDDGDVMVTDVFDKIVAVGPDVSPCHPYKGNNIRKRAGPATAGWLTLVASTEKDPMFTDEDCCFTVGTFDVDFIDKHGNISEVKPVLVFGGTEIEVRIVYETTGEEKKATFHLPD